MSIPRLLVSGVFIVSLMACDATFEPEQTDAVGQARETSSWPEYGGGGGRKFYAGGGSAGTVTTENVADLEVAWIHRTGDEATVFQNTPVLVNGQLVVCTPFNRIVALDPANGVQLWAFDSQIDRSMRPANEFNCRGVAQWLSSDEQSGAQIGENQCASRIFMATNDARLIALDALAGEHCDGFGNDGEVDLGVGVGEIHWAGEYQVTSPPAVVGDVVVVGSAVSDGNRITVPSGVVRGYDVRTGQLRWAFDLAPPGFDYSNQPVSSAGYALGTPNVWSVMSVDADRGLVFLPTGNPAPDYFRSDDPDMGHFGSSVIALNAENGEVVWHFQTVLRDFWDYDVPSQPVLADLELAGETVPALIQSTKMGFVFVLHRETGEPLVEVTYKSVPQTGPLAHRLSPVQPFPPGAFRLSGDYVKGRSMLGLCDEMDEASVAGPIYTPITEQWTIGLPSNMGTTNWGGVAVDPQRGLIAARTSNVPFRTKLISRAAAFDLLQVMEDESLPREKRVQAREKLRSRFDLPQDAEIAPQQGVEILSRHTYLDSLVGAPCGDAPMGEVVMIDLKQESQLWRQPHGTLRDFVGVPLAWGVPGVGGPLLTESGLMFVAGAAEKAIRAYAVETGEELWHHRLPVPAFATPMTYTVKEGDEQRQFVVIAAGGDARVGIGGLGDYLMAFALPSVH